MMIKWSRLLPKRLSKRVFLGATLTVIAFALFSSWIGTHYYGLLPVKGLLNRIDLSVVGLVLPAALGLVTVFGFIVTIVRLGGLYDRINTFEYFLERSVRLIDDATASGEMVRIICHSPPIGNLSVFESKEFGDFRDRLKYNKAKLQILCLRSDDLEKFYHSYDTRLDPAFVNERLQDAKTIYKLFSGGTYYEEESCRLHQQSYANIPHFYLVFSPKRAIIAPVFFLPGFLSHGEAKGAKQPQLGVEVYGYETTDKIMLKKCRQAFNYYRDLPLTVTQPVTTN